MSVQVSLRGILKLIRFDTLCRVHNVGFLVGQFNYRIQMNLNLVTKGEIAKSSNFCFCHHNFFKSSAAVASKHVEGLA